MNVSPELRSWLSQADPKRPDPDGFEAAVRDKVVERIDALSEGELRTQLDEDLKALGGPGSGYFGHAGRPGSIGGSAMPISGSASAAQIQTVRDMLSKFPPEIVIQSRAKRINVVSDKEADDKAREYMLKQYGVSPQRFETEMRSEQAVGFFDEATGTLTTSANPADVLRSYAMTLTKLRARSHEVGMRDIDFTELITGKLAQEIMDIGDPIAFPLEVIVKHGMPYIESGLKRIGL